MKLLKKLTAIIILLSMLITLNSPIISYAADGTESGGTGSTGESTTGEQTEEIGTEYEIKEEKTWDISKNGDGSVIAKWNLEDRSITISGNGEMNGKNLERELHNSEYTKVIEKVTINDGVTNIGYNAFSDCSRLKSIIISNSVTNIGEYAFNKCISLEEIIIPNSVTSIGGRAFWECGKLNNITISNNVTSIGKMTFAMCTSLESIIVDENNPNYISIDGVLYNKEKTQLIEYPAKRKSTSYSIENSATTIEAFSFYGCGNLRSITIPNNVTSIGGGAFEECSSLTSINIPNNVTSIGGGAFEKCSSLTSIEIPSSVTSIEDSTFSGCSSLTSINIPEGVTSIGVDAFEGCSSLKNITIPSSVRILDERAFMSCNNLKNVILSEGLEKIQYQAFSDCENLENLVIPSSITSIDGYAFYRCNSLTSIEIPDSVTNIGRDAFSIGNGPIKCMTNSKAHEYCENNKICYILLDNITSNYTTEYEIKKEETWDISKNDDDSVIANWTLEDKSITISGNGEMIEWNNNATEDWHNKKYKDLVVKVKIESGVKNIGKYAFEKCSSLTNIEMPNSVTSIGKYAFSRCSSIETIKIPDGVTSLVTSIFEDCSNLKNIEISSSVTEIDYSAFLDCNNLENINVAEDNVNFKSIQGVLFNKDLTTLVRYPAKITSESYIIPNSVTSIENYAFSGCQNLKSITIPKNVTDIGWYAFERCSNLTKIQIPKGITTILNHMFDGCTNLTNIEIPSTVTCIRPDVFGGCSSLENIEIPNSVTEIGKRAFKGCSNLTNIDIPQKVNSIGEDVFTGCSSLETINVEEENLYYASIEGILFDKNKTTLICYPMNNKKSSYVIPKSVKIIDKFAFYNCVNLKSITLSSGITSIGENAFNGYNWIETIIIPNSVTSIGSSAFARCSSLKSITIPNSVTSIGDSAFYGCSGLKNITIPSSVTSIGGWAFYGCSSLERINIPNSITSIGNDTFSRCISLTNIEIPSSVTSIGSSAFDGCSSLERINIPNSITSIEEQAFMGCISLENITIPDSVTKIGMNAFNQCYCLIICHRNTEAHRYAESKKIGYVLDEKMPKVKYTPSEFEKAQKQAVVKIEVTDITGVVEDSIKYLWSTKEEISMAEVKNACTNGQELSTPTGKTSTYYLYVYAKDNFGNEGIAKSNPIKLDNTAPKIELANNKYYQKPNVQDENPGTILLTKDGNKVETYKYGDTIYGEGAYQLTATDEAGNSTTKEFVLQKIPTGEEGLNYEISPSELTNQDVTLTVSKKDTTNTELDIELRTDGENYETGTTKTIEENGKVYARLGKEGIYGEALEIEITNIDKTAPVVEGVQDKRSYAKKATPKAVDENLESVKLEKDGQEVQGYVNGTEITELGTYKITAIDKVGNKTEVEFYIKDIPSTQEVVDYAVTPEGLTNQDVKVSVAKKENEEYQDLVVQMSTDGKNYEAVTEKTITENGSVYIRVVKNEEDGTVIEGEVIEVEIKNIDKTAPETQVAYSETNPTNKNVTATITANEEIQEVEEWTRGEDRKTLTKEYEQNAKEEITIKDIVGNETKVNVEITNIDKTAPEGQVTYSETNPTNKNVTATITANEEIQEVEGWTISQDKKKLTKEYDANKTEKIIIKDKVGNEKEVEVKVLNIDKTAPIANVSYNTKKATNQNVRVTITASEKVQGLTGWTLSTDSKTLTKEYSANKTETITIKDLAGNSTNATIKIENIDKTAPTINVKYSTTNLTNGNVTVTVTANEEVQSVVGWALLNDKKSITKTYQSNVEENVQLKDIAGNTTNAKISIKNIDKEKPVITGVENGKVYKDSVTPKVTDANPGTLLLEKDGIKVEGYTNGKEIIEEGTYKLTATDKVGNTTIINFTIKYIRGELNGNNQIDIGDVLLLLRHIAQTNSQKTQQKHPDWKLSEKRTLVGDINKNGTIDIGDVLKIRRYIAAKSSQKVANKHPDWLNIE